LVALVQATEKKRANDTLLSASTTATVTSSNAKTSKKLQVELLPKEY
jgi:hypothetical protein